MKVLIIGALGQLGWELQRTAPESIHITPLDYEDVDITKWDAVARIMSRYSSDCIINAAAYTAVDLAEKEKDKAFALNEGGAANLARAAVDSRARLIQISTDFVFDGNKSYPYAPEDTTNPINVYGLSKREGEKRVLEITGGKAIIIRTAWLYSMHGNNFVKTMLKLLQEKEELCVVADQVGTPTWAKGLSLAIWKVVERPDISGIFHWTDEGVATWYDFAVAIKEEALAIGLLDRNIPIKPVSTKDYPTPALRPSYSVLDKSRTRQTIGYMAPHWRESLRMMLKELKENCYA